MSHLSQFRLGPELGQPQIVNTSKKRRKNNSANTVPVSTPSQDLLPPPLSGYGDTVVASNPFDDCPNTINQIRNGPQMPQSMMPIPLCRPINLNSPLPGHCSPVPLPGSSPLHHHHHHPHSNSIMIGNPRLNMIHGPGSIAGPGLSPNPSLPSSQPPPSQSLPLPPLINGGQVTNSALPMHLQNSPMNSLSNHHHMNHNNSLGPPPPNSIMNNNFLMNPMNSMYQKAIPVNSGKVYPADKPTVFNSQNPNAPPIYPCGVCHKEVHDNDQAILCESGCNFWYHRSCTGLTESAFQLLTNEVYAEWVCDKCLTSKNIPLIKFKS